MNLVATAKEGISKVKTYWKTPPLGKYMNFKEIASLAGGGIGVKFIITCVSAVLLSATNVFVGNTIGIEPMNMYFIYILAVIISFPLTMLRAYIIDNARNRKGKYRPYILTMGLPTIVLAIGYFWMPYEKMGSQMMKCAVVLLFNIGFQFFYNFLYDAYDNYIVVLSPNTQERANVSSIKSVTDSLAPTITNAIIPLLATSIIGTNNLNDIRIYRYIWPPILILGFLLSVIVYVNTEEKIVQAKTHVVQIKFIDAIRAVAKNKYFWVISLAGWLGFLEGAYGSILNWLYSYQHACTGGEYSLIVTIYGNASLWGMLLAPLSIKKLGKKNTLILTNALNIVFIAAIYPVVKYADISVMIWLVMICLWFNALVGSFAHILTPSLNGDIRDYQQYITGERIDGMFAAVGLIGSVITMVTSSVLPAIYEKVGFNETKLAQLLPEIVAQEGELLDPTNVYNVLYHKETFISIFGVLIAVSILGAAMNVIPYFFYDLSEVKQQGMIKVLKIRALFEDYGNGILKDKDLVEAIEIIREANELDGAQPKNIKEYKAAKKHALGKEEKKAAKKAYKEALEFNKNLEISKFVIDEMNRFNTSFGKRQLDDARKAAHAGYEAIYGYDKSELAAAKALPKLTPEEKEYRKDAVSRARDFIDAQKAAAKYYSNNIVEFDIAVFEKLFAKEDELDETLEATYKKLYKARDEKDKDEITRYMQQVKDIKAQQKLLEKEIKKATNDNSVYNRAARPVIKAKKLITQSENYAKFDEIAAMYDEAKARHEKAQAEAAAEAARIAAEEKAYGEKLRAEKAAKRNKK
ncbi:MAG: MFS transporter [Clostridia bacterium]|nr:MFS transporter [Clostridia bacterium]